jgi:hypothetical protein
MEDYQEVMTEIDMLITEVTLDKVKTKEVILNRLQTIKEELQLKNYLI